MPCALRPARVQTCSHVSLPIAISQSTAPSSLSSWAGAGYNYFTSLAPAAQATSCALQGPCYPVLTSQANVWHTCQTQTLNNLPVNPTAVALLQQCFSCCNVPAAQGTAACNATVRVCERLGHGNQQLTPLPFSHRM